jgi:hypothetical protein
VSNGSGITRHSKGYWQLTRGVWRNKLLHRAWFELVLGRPLRVDEEVEHSCFNRGCLNPNHWILMDESLHHGTTAVNNHYKRCPKGDIKPAPDPCTHAQAAQFAAKYIYDSSRDSA